MDQNVFNELVQRPYKFTFNQKREIQALKADYPYCAAIQILDLLSDKACDIATNEAATRRSRLYTANPTHLEQLLTSVLPASKAAPDTNAIKQAIEEQKKEEQAQAEPFDIMREINQYQEVSFKTAPKSVILSNFLENEVCEGLKTESKEPLPIEVITKKSISNDKPVETETLAVIYQKQGKYEKALSIYQKLIAKYPEKSSIFASRISEINNIIETNKN